MPPRTIFVLKSTLVDGRQAPAEQLVVSNFERRNDMMLP
jgi:hypothetical protein